MMSALLQQAFCELEAVYIDLERHDGAESCRACGQCCWFEVAGHSLFATRLETLYLLEKAGAPARPFTAKRCGYHQGRRCRAREGRVLGCRIYRCEEAGGFCSEVAERALAEIKRISLSNGIPMEYAILHARIADLLAAGLGETCSGE